MEKIAYLVKITAVCELDDSTRIITKWVIAEDLNEGNVEIIKKVSLSLYWVWQNELYTMDVETGTPYAVTNDYSVE